MKRLFGLGLLFLTVFIFASSFASAQTVSQAISSFFEEIINIIDPLARLLVGDTTGSGSLTSADILLSKTLFLILIFSVIYLVFSKIEFFNGNAFILFIISFIISILATRWIGGAEVIQTILLPYSTLGAVISGALPFIAWFFLVNVGLKESVPAVRKILWIAFAIVFIFYWGASYNASGAAGWIYPLVALAAIVMMMLDGTIRRYYVKIQLESMGKDSAEEAISKLKKDLKDIDDYRKEGIIDNDAEADRRKKKINRKLAYFSKYT